MYLRNWFGAKLQNISYNNVDICLDGVLELLVKALTQYFSARDVSDADDLIRYVRNQNIPTDQLMFLNWFEKELPNFIKVISNNLPNDEQLLSELEYEKYTLELEMDFEYPDDVRACIVNFLTDFPGRIDKALARVKGNIIPELPGKYLTKDSYCLYNKQVDNYGKPKLKEPVNNRAPFLFCREVKFLCL